MAILLTLHRHHHALWHHNERKDMLPGIRSAVVVNEYSEVNTKRMKMCLKQILFPSVVVASVLATKWIG